MTQLSDKECEAQMEAMRAFDEQMPSVGIFWYDPEEHCLFGVPICGKQSNKAIALWAESHQEEVAGFQEELKEAYNVFARVFELEEIE